jgi:hypothetical protein
MRSQIVACSLFVGLVGFLGSSSSHADEAAVTKTVPCAPVRYEQRLYVRYRADATNALPCLPADSTLGKSLASWSDQIREGSASFALRLQLARAQLVKQSAVIDGLNSTEDASLSTKRAAIKSAIAEAVKDVDQLAASGGSSSSDALKFPALNIDYWKYSAALSPEPAGIPLQYLQDKGCFPQAPDPQGPDARCDGLYAGAVELADDIFIVTRVISLIQSSDRGRLLDEAKTREDRWHAYLYDTQFQFWWELGLNYAVEKTCPGFMRWDCAPADTDPYGNELGFRQPPDRKLIFLHPDVAVEYLHREPAGQRFKPVIAFQWIGFQKWTWEGTSASRLMGISIVSTVADTSVSNRVGTGIMLQWKKFSLAVTARPKEVGIAINLNVVDWIGSVNQGWANKLKAPLPK